MGLDYVVQSPPLLAVPVSVVNAGHDLSKSHGSYFEGGASVDNTDKER